MRIAVYSGSFNPLHIGHLAILRKLSLDAPVDWTYLVVSPKNPLKDGISADTGRDRYRAALKAVARHEELKVWVDDVELSMPEPHYTIRTLDVLKRREPDNDYTLVVGADNLSDIRRWKDYRRILTEYGVMVYPRAGYDLPSVKAGLMEEDPCYRIDILQAPMVDVSSTQIREKLSRGEDATDLLM